MKSQPPRDLPLRVLPWDCEQPRDLLLSREWLVTNGLGGFASGTIAGALTRRYHGWLTAALPPPFGRLVMWSHLSETLRFSDDDTVSLGAEERAGGYLDIPSAKCLVEFRLEGGLPVWVFMVRGLKIEKRVLMPHRRNTVFLRYRVTGDGPLPALELRPAFNFRHYRASLGELPTDPYQFQKCEGGYEIVDRARKFPVLRMRLSDSPGEFIREPHRLHGVIYRSELDRGDDGEGDLWSPGFLRVSLQTDRCVSLLGSTDDWTVIEQVTAADAQKAEEDRRRDLIERAVPAAREDFGPELVLAADQFIITPTDRAEREADDARTLIAGYFWFTDWGRDTMISLEGLTSVTGRLQEAAKILETFAQHLRRGLIPNLFPDGEQEGLYHTADASLWFVHALSRYLAVTRDREALPRFLPVVREIIEHHLIGTDFNIQVDSADGLLCQGAEGYQLTWMDAKMGDWVVTPRRGKAVEINALWFNALMLCAEWMEQTGQIAQAASYRQHADRAYESFNRKFWYADGGYLFDVVEDPEVGSDHSLRPNQVFAISLDHPVLAPEYWAPVMRTVERELLTPVGLRSLAASDPNYKATYRGDIRSRDAAYHQGTVWAWLIGPFIDAWMKLHPQEEKRARAFLSGFSAHLSEAGIGSISEVFDAEPPHQPRGCIAQAWSVAEVLRCLVKTSSPHPPPGSGAFRDREARRILA